MARSILPLAEATGSRCGGKAAILRRLIDAGGLPVPPGFCLSCDLYREALSAAGLPTLDAEPARSWDPGLAAACESALASWRPTAAIEGELARAAGALGWPIICRSSASCEDLGGVASAGVFLSRPRLASLEALCDAIREVWRSLWQPPAWAVLRSSGRWPGSEAMGIVLQPWLHARVSGLLLSRDPGSAERMRLELTAGDPSSLSDGERDPLLLLVPRDGTIEQTSSELRPEEILRLRDAALGLEAALLVNPGPTAALELEWLIDDTRQLLWLQARPTTIVAPPRSFPIYFHRSGDARTLWRWDREHNPEPLSPIHASLIELLDEQAPGPPRHLVLSGYLYQAVRDEPSPAEPAELEAAWHELRSSLERSLERAGALAGSADRLLELEGVLACFGELQTCYGGLGRARRAATDRLRDFLAAHGLSIEEREERLLALGESHATLSLAEESAALAAEIRRDPRLESYLRAPEADPRLAPSERFVARLRELLLRFGCLPQSWDVASATLAEEPARLVPRLLALAESGAEPRASHRAVLDAANTLAASLAARLEPGDGAELLARIAEARLARSLAEDDDLYFARALALLRQTLRACGAELHARGWIAEPAEVFLLELPDLLVTLRQGLPGRDLRAEVARRAAAWEGNRSLVPPLTILGDRLRWPVPASSSPLLRGEGVGGVARGRVRLISRLEDLLARPSRGEVLVCSTLLPALAIALPEAAALVTDHGGLLSHAASLARELGVPAVVGTGRATAVLHEGEQVWVDGARGLVVRL
jgi:pyruvate,water dikinase